MGTLGWIAIAGGTVLGAGGLAALRASLLARAMLVQAVGMAAIGVAGGWSLFGGDTAGGAFRNTIEPAVGIDPLTGFFLAALAVVATPALVYASGYLPGTKASRPVGLLTALFLLALAGVLTARDVGSFLAFWELMTLIPAAAILVRRRDRRARRDTFAYVAITHVGGVGVWLALIALQQAGAIGAPGGLARPGTGLQVFVAVAAVIGFGTKAGLMPAHAWLPRAHPIAPSHFSALMSGMMIKVALYGLIRVLFEWLGGAPLWLGILLLAVGALSSVGGVLYALFQHELKRLLAFHSIENIGIIVLGLGASLTFQSQGEGRWAAIAFAAALLHTLNHALFKSLLFLGAGAFERATGSLELDRLGGLLRRMPWTGGAFAIGAMAIAGVPPFNGFASEWLTLQSLIHVSRAGGVGISLAGFAATAGLAVTAALAVFCFVKVIGLVLLGEPRQRACAVAVEAPWTMRSGMLFLAATCVLLGIAPGLLLPELIHLAPGAQAQPRDVGIYLPGTGNLPAPAIAILFAALFGALLLARGKRVAAPAPTWACGQRVEPALRWTSAGFTKTLRLILEALLRPERAITVRRVGGIVISASYHGSVPHLFETALYRPVVKVSLTAAGIARRVQSGSLTGYVATLIALVALALVLARAGAL